MVEGLRTISSAPCCRVTIPSWQIDVAQSGICRRIYEETNEPYHIIAPHVFYMSALRWFRAAEKSGVPFALRFGKKANKSPSFAKVMARLECEGHDAGLDVASVEELRAALDAGVPGRRIVVTGATPRSEMLELALRHHCLDALSRPEDIELVTHTLERIDVSVVGDASASESPQRSAAKLEVLLRMASASRSTRFGMTRDEIIQSVQSLCADASRSNGNGSQLQIRGVSFHCNGYDINDRIKLARQGIDVIRSLRLLGVMADTLSIGGGFPTASVPYEKWDRVVARLDSTMFVNGRVPQSQYPFGAPVAGEEALERILLSIATDARAEGITIIAEPGRALVQAAGATYFPVRSTHRLPWVDGSVVVVDGTSFSLSEQWFDSEYYPDPYVIRGRHVIQHAGDGTQASADFVAAVAAGTCLDDDYLSRRFIRFPVRPRAGDLVVYPDTAGYQMDSNESEFHSSPVPPKWVLIDPERYRVEKEQRCECST